MKHYVPYWYQKEAASFLLRTPRAALFAGMGTGKTSTVLSVIDILKICGSGFFPALVLAPKRVSEIVWTGERDKWDVFQDISIVKILGDREDRMAALKGKRADVYIINYDNVQWLIETLKGKPWPFKIVIADESTRLKNFRMNQGGARSTALSMIAQYTGRWINLTGTPVTNGLTDLWGQTWFLDYGERLGRTYTIFMNRWFIEDKYSRRIITLPNAESEIHEAISDITLALRTEDCIPDATQPFVVPVEVELPKRARDLYDEMESQFFIDIGQNGIEAFNAAAKSMKLLQLACGCIYDADGNVHEIHEAKLEALRDIVEENGENMLVAYHFKFDAARIQKKFPNARVLRSDKDIADWNAGKIKMMLLHPASAGHGISLQDGGRSITFFGHSWDLELRQQVIERIGAARQIQAGHDRTVLVYNIIARGTIEEACLERTHTKLTIQQALMLAQSRR